MPEGQLVMPRGAAEALAKSADKLLLLGCLLCGTIALGPIGLPLFVVGALRLRQAQRAGVAIRPWSVTFIGALILIDSSYNYLAWGLDLLPAHHTIIGQTVWIGYGRLADGGYAAFYNTTGLGGINHTAEKALQVMCIGILFPMRIAAAWGFLNMKRWGLQWSIITNWLYICVWIIVLVYFQIDFDLRFGVSDFGIIGNWVWGIIPFMGPAILLPYLHTVNKELWSK